MTKRSSKRARAREIYGELAAEKASNTAPTPDPSPHCADVCGGGEKQDLTAASLTARVRKLYEESAAPVREIATIAGVTERTLYKYVIKHDWKRRYAVVPRGEAAARANRGRSLRPSPDLAPGMTQELLPAKGAGGRFIRREDKDKPFPQGLKATDPAGAARASQACGEAETMSRAAQGEAEREARAEAMICAMDVSNNALGEYRAWRERRAKERARIHAKARAQWRPQGVAEPRLAKPTPHDLRIEGLYLQMVSVALANWEALSREEKPASA
jgi:hypothetical protein